MKKITHFIAAAALLTSTLTGCDKKLDVEPLNNAPTEKALLTSADVEAALIGTYDALQSRRLYAGQIQFMSELLADAGEISFVGTYAQPGEAFRKSLLVNNAFVANTWTESYRLINTANSVLANINKVETAKRDRVEGEAKFLRAITYFELVRLYARDWNDGNPQTNLGVPLVLTPTEVIDAAAQVSRNTVAEVYTQVIQDLTDAEAKIPASNGVFATKYSASGFLSRVYLQQSRYADAAAAANRTIASGKVLVAYADEFTTTTNTTEDIFAVQVTAQDALNELTTYFSTLGRSDVEIQPQHLALYEAGDARRAFFKTSGGIVYTRKFDQPYGNVKVMRLAEMYLTRAEANFRSGTTIGSTPTADINRIRSRAGLAPLTTVTLDNILKERHLELAFEGFRLGDVKRNKENVGTIPYNSTRLVYPIPQRELDTNKSLKQNEGYN
jgi:hypothetical protein